MNNTPRLLQLKLTHESVGEIAATFAENIRFEKTSQGYFVILQELVKLDAEDARPQPDPEALRKHFLQIAALATVAANDVLRSADLRAAETPAETHDVAASHGPALQPAA